MGWERPRCSAPTASAYAALVAPTPRTQHINRGPDQVPEPAFGGTGWVQTESLISSDSVPVQDLNWYLSGTEVSPSTGRNHSQKGNSDE